MTRILILILCCISLNAVGQVNADADTLQTINNDSLVAESRDTVLLKSYATRYDPRKALLYAAVLPGLGQIYNKKYWKLPLVWGGFAATGYAINFYQDHYTKAKFDLFRVIDNELPVYHQSFVTEDQLRNIVNRYRRERDFYIIIMAGVYLLQIVDAHVDAHLKEFDLNPNLQVRLEPMIDYSPMTGRQTGVSLVLKF